MNGLGSQTWCILVLKRRAVKGYFGQASARRLTEWKKMPRDRESMTGLMPFTFSNTDNVFSYKWLLKSRLVPGSKWKKLRYIPQLNMRARPDEVIVNKFYVMSLETLPRINSNLPFNNICHRICHAISLLFRLRKKLTGRIVDKAK